MPRVDDSSTRVRVGKVPFEISGLDRAVRTVIDAARGARSIPVRLSNAYCVALASKNADYSTLLNSRGLNFPDGAPVVWAMRSQLNSKNHSCRVRGPSLFRLTMDRGRKYEIRHFLLGTDESTLDKLILNLQRNYPGVVISGHYAPPYGPVDREFLERCVEKIQQTNAQIIWVALGTPKQDFVAAELSERVRLPCVGVGAAFDFEAGVLSEAPIWVQKLNLEWAYRFASEPRRLWRRYVYGNMRFIYTVFFETHDRFFGRLS